MRRIKRGIKIEIERSVLRPILFTIPAWALIAFFTYMFFIEGHPFNLYDPYEALKISFIVATALIPSAAYEYRLEWGVRSAENEIPVMLSVIENSLRSGLSLPESLLESTNYVSYLKRDLTRVLNALTVGESIDTALNRVRRDTPLLSVTADYLRVLARGGEELFKTLRDFRESIEVMIGYSRKLREATRSFIATIYLVMLVYIVTTVIFLKTFIFPLSEEVSGTSILTAVDPYPLTALIIYGALVESVINGITTSYFTGSRYLSSIFHSLILLFISIAVYSTLLYTL